MGRRGVKRLAIVSSLLAWVVSSPPGRNMQAGGPGEFGTERYHSAGAIYRCISAGGLRRWSWGRIRGGSKGKVNKHSKKELNQKIRAATSNTGGGKAGLQDPKGGEAGHAKLECPVCGVKNPSETTLRIHHEAKHPKIPFEPNKATNVHDKFNGTTKGVAVHGTLRCDKRRKKDKRKGEK